MLRRLVIPYARRLGFHGVEWYLRKLNYTRKIWINGIEMKIPSIRGITCNLTEPWMITLLSKVLKVQSGVFLDVGVNVGQTLIKVKAIDHQREYIGFEPNPACVFYVLDLIKENNFINCAIFPVGLFLEDCVLSLDLFSSEETDAAASIIENFRPGRCVNSIFVPVFRFDSLAKPIRNKHIGIIKIDVEGAELEVVKSLLTLIRRDRPIILLEVLPVFSDKNINRKNRQNELEQIFVDNDYTLFRVEITSTKAYLGLRRIEEIGIHSDSKQRDYVIVPNEQLVTFQMSVETNSEM